MSPLKAPQDCATMAELRTQIDAVDAGLIRLLAQRAAYIDRAVALKKNEGLPARIDDRIAVVIGQVRAEAANAGFDPDLAEKIWRILIDWAIQREEQGLSR